MLTDPSVNNIDPMVNNEIRTLPNVRQIAVVLRVYLVVVLATLIALIVLSNTAADQAPSEAWGHAVIVAVFAVLLPLRLRSAARGSVGALRAVGLIAAALFLVNVIEALIPGFVPVWMRFEMIGVAVLMALVILLVVRERV